jgi:hypothetical protein
MEAPKANPFGCITLFDAAWSSRAGVPAHGGIFNHSPLAGDIRTLQNENARDRGLWRFHR